MRILLVIVCFGMLSPVVHAGELLDMIARVKMQQVQQTEPVVKTVSRAQNCSSPKVKMVVTEREVAEPTVEPVMHYHVQPQRRTLFGRLFKPRHACPS